MPETPDRKIEALLRAYAAKRREDSGAPLEMHPATRRLLQAEVARLHPRHATAPRRWWTLLGTLWPRLAFAASVLMALGICLWWGVPRGDQALRMARHDARENTPMPDSSPAQPAADAPFSVVPQDAKDLPMKPVGPKQLGPATASRPAAPAAPAAKDYGEVDRDSARLRSARRAEAASRAEPAVALAPTSSAKTQSLPPGQTANGQAPGATASPRLGHAVAQSLPSAASRSLPAGKAGEVPSRWLAQTSESLAAYAALSLDHLQQTTLTELQTNILGDLRAVQSLSFAYDPTRVPTGIAPGTMKPVVATAKAEPATALPSRTIAPRTAGVAELAREVQYHFIAVPSAALERAKLGAPISANALSAFDFKRKGDRVSIAEADGSVYDGSVLNEQEGATQELDGAFLWNTDGPSREGQGNLAAPQGDKSPARGKPVLVFRATGTNRTLNQPVLIRAVIQETAEGNLRADLERPHDRLATPRAAGQTAPPTVASGSGETALRLEGRLRIGTNESFLRAVRRLPEGWR